jgi:curved DNA-binding protein CbpA
MPAPAASNAPKPGDPKRRAEIEARADLVEKDDYFKLLGLERTAEAGDIQKAYFAFAKTWHPDRLPGDLQDLKPQVAKVFARITEAYQTLNDPAKRATYVASLDIGGGAAADEAEEIARVVDAALEFQKAEVLLKKNDLQGAEQLAKRAAMADPEQPDYVTLLTWIQAERRGMPQPVREGQTSTHYDDLIRTLDGILTKEPQYEKALYYRGMLLKRAGKLDRSIRDFRLVAQLNPKNIDAVREVRLFEMRKRAGKKDGGGEGGGLFGKFFKR